MSAGEKPAERRRSKPWGAGVVVDSPFCVVSDIDIAGWLVCATMAASASLAAVASASSSEEERRVSAIEQWM